MVQESAAKGQHETRLTDADKDVLKGPYNALRAVDTFFLQLKKVCTKTVYDRATKSVLNLNSTIRKGKLDLNKVTQSGSVHNIYKSRRHELDPEVAPILSAPLAIVSCYWYRTVHAHATTTANTRVALQVPTLFDINGNMAIIPTPEYKTMADHLCVGVLPSLSIGRLQASQLGHSAIDVRSAKHVTACKQCDLFIISPLVMYDRGVSCI